MIGIGKLIQQGTRISDRKSEHGAASANNGRCCQMDKSGQLHAQGQQGLGSQLAAVWKKEFHEKMRELKGKFSLNPILLILTTFPKFMLELHGDMYCMHRILHDR